MPQLDDEQLTDRYPGLVSGLGVSKQDTQWVGQASGSWWVLCCTPVSAAVGSASLAHSPDSIRGTFPDAFGP